MKSTMTGCLTFCICFGLSARGSAQVDTEPELNSVLRSTESSEDIPPPTPVPENSVPNTDETIGESSSPSAVPVPRSPQDGQEVRAYDFGISYRPTAQGLAVQGVLVNSHASSAGIRPRDVIVAIDDQTATAELLSGPIETVEVVRGGVSQTLTVGTQVDSGTARYVPQNQTAYSVPRTSTTTVPRNQSAYRSPRTYGYSPAYDNRYAPNAIYRDNPYSDYRRYRYQSRPRISIGYGTGFYGPSYGGFRTPYGLGPGRGGYYGRGYRGSGFSISIGF